MDKEFNNIMQGLNNIQNQTKELINEKLDQETFNSLPIEQQNLINEARKGLDFSGKESLSSRINHLTKTLQQNGL